MVKIFISYRRMDTAAEAGRIYDRLVASFGKRNVFKDVDTIPAGQDFRSVLTDWIHQSDIMLVLIGTNWLSLTESDGITPRIHNPSDYVHYEINLGLRSSQITVIPVTVGTARLPSESELPEALRILTYLNAVSVRNDPDFHHDVDRLITQIKRIAPRPLLPIAIIASILMGIAAGFLVWSSVNATPLEFSTLLNSSTSIPVVSQTSIPAIEASIQAEMRVIATEAKGTTDALVIQNAMSDNQPDRFQLTATGLVHAATMTQDFINQQTEAVLNGENSPIPGIRATAEARSTEGISIPSIGLSSFQNDGRWYGWACTTFWVFSYLRWIALLWVVFTSIGWVRFLRNTSKLSCERMFVSILAWAIVSLPSVAILWLEYGVCR